MKLWPVEHFCPHFFSGSALISTDLEKSEDKIVQLVRVSFVPKYLTSYKIHILATNVIF